jgi:programmed cell death protein 5
VLARRFIHFSFTSFEMDPSQLQAVSASELPEGFTLADPGPSQQPQSQQQQLDQQKQQQKQAILEQALTSDALARLRRIKLVKNVDSLENGIVSMAVSGKLPGPITEGKLIEMLERINPQNRESNKAANTIQIQRKKYAFDSDDEDDNDDDV